MLCTVWLLTWTMKTYLQSGCAEGEEGEPSLVHECRLAKGEPSLVHGARFAKGESIRAHRRPFYGSSGGTGRGRRGTHGGHRIGETAQKPNLKHKGLGFRV